MSLKACFVLSGFLCINCLFFSTSFAETNNFVIKKDVKKISTKASKSKLQENTCEVFADQISCIPDINQKVSQIQKILLEQTCKYLESSGDCIILKSDKQKMDEILRIAKIFEEKMEDFVQDCDKYLQYLKALK